MNWLDEVDPAKARESKQPAGETPRDTGNEWSSLFQDHPEGGGPFGGRDNALTVLVGFLRAKSFPIEAALEYAEDWNNRHCKPPMDAFVVRDKVQRGWVDWLAGGLDDATPETAAAPKPSRNLRFLTMDDLAEEAAKAGRQEWIVPDLIISGGVHYITAPPGGGKSWVAVDLARAVAVGGKWLDYAIATKCRVLYINEEMGAGTFFQRLDDIGASADGFWALQQAGVKLDNPEHLAQVVRFVVENQIKVVVLDTFVRTHNLDENSNTDMARVYDLFKRINSTGASVVALHHHRKGGVSSPVAHEMMRGAGELAAQADLIAAIDKADDGFVWKTTKHRHLEDSKWPKFGFRLTTNEDGSKVFEQTELEDAQEGVHDARTRAFGSETTHNPSGRILSVIANSEGLTSTDIAKEAGCRRATVDEWLSRLERDGLIRKEHGARGKTGWYTASIF